MSARRSARPARDPRATADRVDRGAAPSPGRRRRRAGAPAASPRLAACRAARGPRQPWRGGAAAPPPSRRLADRDAAYPTGGAATRGSPASALLVQQGVHERDGAVPLGLAGGELPPSHGRDRVEARLPVVVGHAPGGAYAAALLEAHEARIERTHVELHASARDLLDA